MNAGLVALAGVIWMCVETGRAADEPAIVPRPVQIERTGETFALTPATRIVAAAAVSGAPQAAEYLAEVLRAATGWALPIDAGRISGVPPAGSIVIEPISSDAALGSLFEQEGYRLTITATHIRLGAPQPAGLMRGVQTIRQLLPAVDEPPKSTAKLDLPGAAILDYPRYSHRGMLLDCGRHFMPPEFVKRYIDLLAYHKLNVLHWHLTEDQGWRIEIRKYPRLTEVGAWRTATRDSEHPRDPHGRYGGFYTQQQIREIVAYAASRHVAVIPEIEMPGHSLAALAAYPELSCAGGPFEVGTRWGVYEDVYCAGNEQTFAFLEDVLSEVLDLFPAPFIHIGGDECPKTRWKACPKCQQRIRAERLKDEPELQSYFIRRIERFLSGRGRRLIGWDEILEGGLPPMAAVQSWRGLDGAIAAARSGHDVISSPTSHCYLDYPQERDPQAPDWMGLIELRTAYSFEPTPPQLAPEQARYVLGLEGNIWTERAPPARVDYQVFPRLCALAEVGWSPAAARDWPDFQRRLQTHLRRLDRLGVTYWRPAPPR